MANVWRSARPTWAHGPMSLWALGPGPRVLGALAYGPWALGPWALGPQPMGLGRWAHGLWAHGPMFPGMCCPCCAQMLHKAYVSRLRRASHSTCPSEGGLGTAFFGHWALLGMGCGTPLRIAGVPSLPQGRCAPGPMGPEPMGPWSHGPWAHGPMGSGQGPDDQKTKVINPSLVSL